MEGLLISLRNMPVRVRRNQQYFSSFAIQEDFLSQCFSIRDSLSLRSRVPVAKNNPWAANTENSSSDFRKCRFIVCACYRSEKVNTEPANYISSLNFAIELMFKCRQEIILVGDYNL